jgi:hypothetical protein
MRKSPFSPKRSNLSVISYANIDKEMRTITATIIKHRSGFFFSIRLKYYERLIHHLVVHRFFVASWSLYSLLVLASVGPFHLEDCEEREGRSLK